MKLVEVIKALGNDVDKMLADIPLDHVIKGLQVNNRPLYVKYFKGSRLDKSGRRRVRDLIDQEIGQKGNEELAQLFQTLWNRANGRLYHAMYSKVRSINPEVDKIVRIEDERALKFMDDLLLEFDADRIYLCVMLDEVRFSKEAVKEKLGKEIPLESWPPPPEAEKTETAEEKRESGVESEQPASSSASEQE